MKVYKLTDQNMETRNHTKWGENVTHKTDGKGDLCGPGWLHCYSDPLLAIILNSCHGNFDNPILWEAEGTGEQKDDSGLKMGFSKLTTIRKISIPEVSLNQKIAFGILCALKVYKVNNFVAWAEKWLSEEDRSANAAANAAYAAANAAAAAAASSAAYAAANAAANAANAAHRAASAAAAAASSAANAPLDLISIAKEAMTYK